MVGADSDEQLARILMRLQVHGVNQVDPGEAATRPAPADGVFPDDFYSTTNLETVVRLGGQWVPVEQPEMDCGLLVTRRPRSAPCRSATSARATTIVCGAAGVRVVLPIRDHKAVEGDFGS